MFLRSVAAVCFCSVLPFCASATASVPRLPSAVLSWSSPRVFVIDEFLSPAECEELIALGRDRLKPSQIADAGSGVVSVESRRNEQMFFDPAEAASTPVLRSVIERLHRAALLPPDLGENLQLGRYEEGDFYAPHYDTPQEVGGMAAAVGGAPVRQATVLVFASEVTRGGETLFLRRPLAGSSGEAESASEADRWARCENSKDELERCCRELAAVSDQAEEGGSDGRNLQRRPLLVHPAVGRAVVFFHRDWEGDFDPHSAHAACPVLEGEKWVMQRFIRAHAPIGGFGKVGPSIGAEKRQSESSRMETKMERWERRIAEEEERVRGVVKASEKRASRYGRDLERFMAESDASERESTRVEI